MKDVYLQIRIPSDLKEKLEKKAIEEGSNSSVVVRKLIRSYIDPPIDIDERYAKDLIRLLTTRD